MASEKIIRENIVHRKRNLGHRRENQQSAYAKTKVQTSFMVTYTLRNRIEQSLFLLNPKFQASSLLLCLYSSDCVEPVRKPHCWFSEDGAHLFVLWCNDPVNTFSGHVRKETVRPEYQPVLQKVNHNVHLVQGQNLMEVGFQT